MRMRERLKTGWCVRLALAMALLLGGCAPSTPRVRAADWPKPVAKSWCLGPFVKQDSPILEPRADSVFYCPVRQEAVRWEQKDVFNPSAVVRDGGIWLIYRAEDKVGRFNGTSRLGLANSPDGLAFSRERQPVLYPTNDCMRNYEWEGGVEDPRVVEDDDGTYWMTYTAFDGCNVELMVASSRDLHTWVKHGPVHKRYAEEGNLYVKSKAGAIVCRQREDRHIAAKIKGRYWMYWFNDEDRRDDLRRHMCCSTSLDLKNWRPVLDPNGTMKPVLKPRKGMFDSRLTEPGPHALLTRQGIVLIYNGMNLPEGHEDRDRSLPGNTYSAGQALFACDDPTRLADRMEYPFLTPDRPYEIRGQVDRVCFVTGLVRFNRRYFVYYGTADSKIAVAVWETRDSYE
jgi:predicted GH43/DUF377 family glycosyl hydrolase